MDNNKPLPPKPVWPFPGPTPPPKPEGSFVIGWEELHRFNEWCFHHIPTIFDNCMSHYEQLCKIQWFFDRIVHNMEVMRIAFEKLQADEEEFKDYIKEQWQKYQDDLNQQWTNFQNSINQQWAEYKSNLNKEWADYKDEMTADWMNFQADITQQWNTYKTQLTAEWGDYKTQMNTVWEDYKNSLNSAWTSYQNSMNSKWEAYQNSMNAAWTTFQNNLTQEWTDYKTLIDGEMNNFKTTINQEWTDYKNEMNKKFSDLQTYVNNYFDSQDWQAMVEEALEKMKNSGELGTELAKLVNPYQVPHNIGYMLAAEAIHPDAAYRNTNINRATFNSVNNKLFVAYSIPDSNPIAVAQNFTSPTSIINVYNTPYSIGSMTAYKNGHLIAVTSVGVKETSNMIDWNDYTLPITLPQPISWSNVKIAYANGRWAITNGNKLWVVDENTTPFTIREGLADVGATDIELDSQYIYEVFPGSTGEQATFINGIIVKDLYTLKLVKRQRLPVNSKLKSTPIIAGQSYAFLENGFILLTEMNGIFAAINGSFVAASEMNSLFHSRVLTINVNEEKKSWTLGDTRGLNLECRKISELLQIMPKWISNLIINLNSDTTDRIIVQEIRELQLNGNNNTCGQVYVANCGIITLRDLEIQYNGNGVVARNTNIQMINCTTYLSNGTPLEVYGSNIWITNCNLNSSEGLLCTGDGLGNIRFTNSANNINGKVNDKPHMIMPNNFTAENVNYSTVTVPETTALTDVRQIRHVGMYHENSIDKHMNNDPFENPQRAFYNFSGITPNSHGLYQAFGENGEAYFGIDNGTRVEWFPMAGQSAQPQYYNFTGESEYAENPSRNVFLEIAVIGQIRIVNFQIRNTTLLKSWDSSLPTLATFDISPLNTKIYPFIIPGYYWMANGSITSNLTFIMNSGSGRVRIQCIGSPPISVGGTFTMAGNGALIY